MQAAKTARNSWRKTGNTTMKAILAMNPGALPHVFTEKMRARLEELLDVDTSRTISSFDEVAPDELTGLDVLITGWGAPPIGPAELDAMPNLQAIVHWGGGLDFVHPAAKDRGILVSSAREANAIPVAEFTLAMIVLAAKDALWASRRYCAEQRPIDRESELPHTGLNGTTVGIIGASSIGSLVMERLTGYDTEVLLYDPWVTPEQAKGLRAEVIPSLDDLARRSSILSVHAPETSATQGMISRSVLAALPDGGTLINTSRGALVDQDALVTELETGRIRAILDVTDPEALPPGHPLYALPNVFLTPHLAGSTGSELRRLGESALAEIEGILLGIREVTNPAP